MHRSNYLFWVLLGALSVTVSITCAPNDEPPSAREGSSGGGELPVTPRINPPPARPDRLQERIEIAIDQVRKRDMLTTNGFWTVFHGILGLGPSVTLQHPDTGERVVALDYICSGGELRGLQFIPTKHGLDVQSGPQFVGQGHQDQFIAEMAQWGMPLDRKMIVHGKDYTFKDFVNHAVMRARTNPAANQELSWAILVLAQYYGTDYSWTNGVGEKLHFEDVVRYEKEANVEQAACGGTHRLFGLTWAYHLHLQKGGKSVGIWQDVADHLRKYQELARKHQNPDGSFSTNFFRGPGNQNDLTLRMNTTGHMFEWLAYSLSDEQLREPWMQDAANALALMFLEITNAGMEGGTLYHASHGLLIYYARVYGPEKLGPNCPLVPLPNRTIDSILTKK